jgi:hypothetical protein
MPKYFVLPSLHHPPAVCSTVAMLIVRRIGLPAGSARIAASGAAPRRIVAYA